MSSSKNSPNNAPNHPFGPIFGTKVTLHADVDKVIFRAAEEDKVMLREFAQWSKLMNSVYNAEVTRDLRTRYMTQEQHDGPEGEYWKKTIYLQFAILKHFYQDRYQKYNDLAQKYDIGKDYLVQMERLMKGEIEELLIDGIEE